MPKPHSSRAILRHAKVVLSEADTPRRARRLRILREMYEEALARESGYQSKSRSLWDTTAPTRPIAAKVRCHVCNGQGDIRTPDGRIDCHYCYGKKYV